MLTHKELRKLIIYKSDGKLLWSSVHLTHHGKEAGTARDRDGYYQIRVNDILYKVHRIIWYWHYGDWPKGQIDHINRNKGDNRIENLRDITQTQNARNCDLRKCNTSGYRGVLKTRIGKWQSQIKLDGSYINLGIFEFKHEAISARRKVERENNYILTPIKKVRF